MTGPDISKPENQPFSMWAQGKTIASVDDTDAEWVKIKFTDGTAWHFVPESETGFLMVEADTQ